MKRVINHTLHNIDIQGTVTTKVTNKIIGYALNATTYNTLTTKDNSNALTPYEHNVRLGK